MMKLGQTPDSWLECMKHNECLPIRGGRETAFKQTWIHFLSFTTQTAPVCVYTETITLPLLRFDSSRFHSDSVYWSLHQHVVRGGGLRFSGAVVDNTPQSQHHRVMSPLILCTVSDLETREPVHPASPPHPLDSRRHWALSFNICVYSLICLNTDVINSSVYLNLYVVYSKASQAFCGVTWSCWCRSDQHMYDC